MNITKILCALILLVTMHSAQAMLELTLTQNEHGKPIYYETQDGKLKLELGFVNGGGKVNLQDKNEFANKNKTLKLRPVEKLIWSKDKAELSTPRHLMYEDTQEKPIQMKESEKTNYHYNIDLFEGKIYSKTSPDGYIGVYTHPISAKVVYKN